MSDTNDTTNKNLDYKVAALVVLQEHGVGADIQEYLVQGNQHAGIPAGLLDRVIEAVLKEHNNHVDWEKKELVDENKALKSTLEAFNMETEDLIGYISDEDCYPSDPDDIHSTSVFISSFKTELYQYPVYRAPVTRNRILTGVQSICDKIIKPDFENKGDPDTDFWRSNAAREIKDEIEKFKQSEQFDFETATIMLVNSGEEEVICVRNTFMPAFMNLQAIARKPKIMSNDEWRACAEIIIKALKRQL